MPDKRMVQFFAPVLSPPDLVARPPQAKFPAGPFQFLNEHRESRVPRRTTTTRAKLRQHPLRHSFPIHHTSPKLLIGEYKPDDIMLIRRECSEVTNHYTGRPIPRKQVPP